MEEVGIAVTVDEGRSVELGRFYRQTTSNRTPQRFVFSDSRLWPNQNHERGKPMSECPQCGKRFECGMADVSANAGTSAAASPCWCTTLPMLPASLLGRDAASCYCPDCLRALLAGTHRDTGIA
jgi:hypothetical protein